MIEDIINLTYLYHIMKIQHTVEYSIVANPVASKPLQKGRNQGGEGKRRFALSILVHVLQLHC